MPPAPSQGQQNDNSMSLLWIIVGVCLLILIIAYFFGVQIVNAYLQLKQYEIRALLLVFPSHANLLEAQRLALMPITTLKDSIGLGRVQTVATTTGIYLRIPVIVFCVGVAALVYFTNGAARYRKRYSMKSLFAQEKNNWPQIAPLAHLDLVKEDIDQGPWAMAMNPMQFAKKYGLLKVERSALTPGQLLREAKLLAGADIGKATRVFALQLGPLWRGIDHLNAHTKALFAVFIARAHGEADDVAKSRALLAQFSVSSDSGAMNFSGVDALCEKYRDSKLLKRLVQKHAYVLTLLASLLQIARLQGVLATADFLWLKPKDRSLWFMLNSVGRQTPFTEVAGPFAHWLAEKTIDRRLVVPHVSEAAIALDLGVRDIIYVPEEEEES